MNSRFPSSLAATAVLLVYISGSMGCGADAALEENAAAASGRTVVEPTTDTPEVPRAAQFVIAGREYREGETVSLDPAKSYPMTVVVDVPKSFVEELGGDPKFATLGVRAATPSAQGAWFRDHGTMLDSTAVSKNGYGYRYSIRGTFTFHNPASLGPLKRGGMFDFDRSELQVELAGGAGDPVIVAARPVTWVGE